MRKAILVAIALAAFAAAVGPSSGRAAGPTDPPVYAEPLGIGMESWPYPYPVHFMPLELEGQPLRMAYMDVPPEGPDTGRAILLLHGKNFGGFYWDGPIRFLARAGYRVIVPDQIGFGRSSKPELHYSFDLLGANTKALLDMLRIQRIDIIGHSTGGMLAMRMALSLPDLVDRLVLEDPIGLEDYRRFVAPRPTEMLAAAELAQTQEGYRKLVQGYFVHWRPEYEKLVEPYARMMLSGEYPRFAKAAALTYQMIYQQPVVYELPLIQAPTLLVVGLSDHAAIGRQYAPPEARQRMGDWTRLGKDAARAIPGARLVEFEDVGHIPHIEVPERFERAVLEFLAPAAK
jgi:pimeloyl-ACP methyl ester carboxylesterase